MYHRDAIGMRSLDMVKHKDRHSKKPLPRVKVPVQGQLPENSLLGLPSKLRNPIYEFMEADATVAVTDFHDGPAPRWATWQFLGATQAYRLMRAEYRSSFFAAVKISVPVNDFELCMETLIAPPSVTKLEDATGNAVLRQSEERVWTEVTLKNLFKLMTTSRFQVELENVSTFPHRSQPKQPIKTITLMELMEKMLRVCNEEVFRDYVSKEMGDVTLLCNTTSMKGEDVTWVFLDMKVNVTSWKKWMDGWNDTKFCPTGKKQCGCRDEEIKTWSAESGMVPEGDCVACENLDFTAYVKWSSGRRHPHLARREARQEAAAKLAQEASQHGVK
ncbi:hypothetical protein C7974DRAFT_473288 [Boeremia exigua]|uniref:uncharacterized protein n=1 Tax=Boeremia exigua TaxID=749465 RepID=UPI001E8D0073|nr:uncharacterized protein C7974DRAFT_473288 [Boeremia exigua]KAH6621843.1 hypothetical protein C7974DRAFT_473288 [Boeremia exigua]